MKKQLMSLILILITAIGNLIAQNQLYSVTQRAIYSHNLTNKTYTEVIPIKENVFLMDF